MASKVAERLNQDPIKLRFTTTVPSTAQPKSIIKRSLNQCISDIISGNYQHPSTAIILYERLEVSIVELETKRSLRIIWTGVHNKEEATHSFLLPKTSNIHDLSEQLAKKVTLVNNGKIRIFEVHVSGKSQKEFTGGEMIGNIPDPVELFAEEIPREEAEAGEADKVINVFHFSKEVTRTHGVPFRFVVKPVSGIEISYT